MDKFFFAQKAFVVKENKLLMIQKSGDDPDQAGKWEVPGGRMKFGEDVDEHIIREVKEEVNVDIIPSKPFYAWQWQLRRKDSNNEYYNMQIVALARLATSKNIETSTSGQEDDDYIQNAKWVPLKEIDEYDWIKNMLPVVAEFKKVISNE